MLFQIKKIYIKTKFILRQILIIKLPHFFTITIFLFIVLLIAEIFQNIEQAHYQNTVEVSVESTLISQYTRRPTG